MPLEIIDWCSARSLVDAQKTVTRYIQNNLLHDFTFDTFIKAKEENNEEKEVEKNVSQESP